MVVVVVGRVFALVSEVLILGATRRGRVVALKVVIVIAAVANETRRTSGGNGNSWQDTRIFWQYPHRASWESQKGKF